jgi:saccharopine dehydrogenase-like NADP-dependent oxidoreductase
MRVLLVGVGTVGEAIARLSARHAWCESLVLADFDTKRAESLQTALGDPQRFPVEHIDARDAGAVAALARRHRSDLVMNAVDPQFVMPLFAGALQAGTHYMDMAASLSVPHPIDPYRKPGVKLGDEQFAQAGEWERAGRLALIGMGMDPGLSDVFARYAKEHLFDQVHEVHVRDGGDLAISGYAFAPVFSIWTTIEECLNPPVVWDAEQGGWVTTQPFSAPESFPFPDGVGPTECVNVEHEEVLLVPRWLPEVRRVTFKYALGSDFIEKLKTIRDLGLHRTDKVNVKGVEVAPRDLLAAITPDPITLGDRMSGRAMVGTWVIGRKDGRDREVFLYQSADAAETWSRYRVQVVGWQTGFNPVVAMELLASGAWSGSGVLGPEAFDASPYLAILDRDGIHWAMAEMEPGAHRPT